MQINREPYEFTYETRLEGLKRAEFCCQRCGKHKKEVGQLYAHHVLPINIAIKYYPHILPEYIKSVQNLRMVCKECHMYEDDESKQNHVLLAQALLGYFTQQMAFA